MFLLYTGFRSQIFTDDHHWFCLGRSIRQVPKYYLFLLSTIVIVRWKYPQNIWFDFEDNNTGRRVQGNRVVAYPTMVDEGIITLNATKKGLFDFQKRDGSMGGPLMRAEWFIVQALALWLSFHIEAAPRTLMRKAEYRWRLACAHNLCTQRHGQAVQFIVVGGRPFVIVGGPLSIYIVVCVHRVYTRYIRAVYSIYSPARKRRNS